MGILHILSSISSTLHGKQLLSPAVRKKLRQLLQPQVLSFHPGSSYLRQVPCCIVPEQHLAGAWLEAARHVADGLQQSGCTDHTVLLLLGGSCGRATSGGPFE